MKNVGLTKGIVNIGGLIDYAPIASAGAPISGPAFGNQADAANPGEKFYGLNFGGDINYYSEVMTNQGATGVQTNLLAMWLTKGIDGFYHIVIARNSDMNGIETVPNAIADLSGVARCNFKATAAETHGWAWVKGNVGTGEDWNILFTGANTFKMANENEEGVRVNRVPVYYNWFTNSGKVSIGSMCKLIDTGLATA